jgi:phage terminase small subunit
MSPSKKLSLQQQIFVDEYLKCFNGAEAARLAGYSEKTARTIACANLTKPYIKAIIDARIAESQMSADEALILLAKHARASIADVINGHGEVDWNSVKEKGDCGCPECDRQSLACAW